MTLENKHIKRQLRDDEIPEGVYCCIDYKICPWCDCSFWPTTTAQKMCKKQACHNEKARQRSIAQAKIDKDRKDLTKDTHTFKESVFHCARGTGEKFKKDFIDPMKVLKTSADEIRELVYFEKLKTICRPPRALKFN
jgi:hypothetical protein